MWMFATFAMSKPTGAPLAPIDDMAMYYAYRLNVDGTTDEELIKTTTKKVKRQEEMKKILS